MPASLHLYSYKACPFARRTRMTLLEKGLEFTLSEIDIRNKPANFASISPYGKVPVLLHDDTRLYESNIINEYLDECFPKPALMPAEPAVRAQARIWMDYCNTRFSAASWNYMGAGKDHDKVTLAREELQQCFRFIETQGLSKLGTGPWWLGSEFSLVDIQFLPFMQQHLNEDRVNIPPDCPRLHTWLDHAIKRASFIATAQT